MRFKKLRITLGITIAIFILIVANIIIFGGFGEEVKAIPKNNFSLKVGQNNIQTQGVQTKGSSESQNQVQAPPIQQQVPTPTPTVTHTFRTRAS